MVVKKKENSKKVDEFLSKGGNSSHGNGKEPQGEWTTLCLRIPSSMKDKMDKQVKKRAALSRTAWILEAIKEKIDEDQE